MKLVSFLFQIDISGGNMILSIVTYLIYALLILAGIKFAGVKQFESETLSLDKTKALRGIAAVGVILHHISQQAAYRETGNLTFFSEIGIFFVSIFLFCSGYGLVKSLKSKDNYFDGFIKNRIFKTLVITVWVNAILYALFLCFYVGKSYPVSQLVTSILGFTMLNDYGWFPIVLAVLYFAFYLAFRKNKSEWKGNLIIFAVIVLMWAISCIGGHFTWWAGPENWYLTDEGWAASKWWMDLKIFWFSGEWWVNTCISFLGGIIFAQNEEKITEWFKKNYWIKLLALVILFVGAYFLQNFALGKFGYWTEWNGTGPGILDKTITLLLQQPVIITFVVLLYVLLMKFNFGNPVIRFFGNNSYESYMMNYMAVLLFWKLIYEGFSETPVIKAGNGNLVLYEVLVFAVTVLLGIIYKYICKYAKKLIK